eukprot:SAG22_NODE_1797_length_3550_cov_2.119386_2_plen_32_part_00
MTGVGEPGGCYECFKGDEWIDEVVLKRKAFK